MKKSASQSNSRAKALTLSAYTLLASSVTDAISRHISFSNNSSFSSLSRKIKSKWKKILPTSLLIIALILVLVVAGKSIVSNVSKPAKSADQRVAIAGPISTLTIGKEFQFPLKDNKGKEITKLKYVIENAEIRSEIIVKGKRATAVKGRLFLIFNLKLVNDYDKALSVSARDYIRLSLNGDKAELLAPDIHNDPVEVQAISTKLTRLGLAINESDKNITLYVGEISSTKETIELNFNK